MSTTLALEMYRPMLDIRVCSLGFTLDQTIYFMGNDCLSAQIRALETLHDLDKNSLNKAFIAMEGTYLDLDINGFQITLQIYDLSPGGFAIQGLEG